MKNKIIIAVIIGSLVIIGSIFLICGPHQDSTPILGDWKCYLWQGEGFSYDEDTLKDTLTLSVSNDKTALLKINKSKIYVSWGKNGSEYFFNAKDGTALKGKTKNGLLILSGENVSGNIYEMYFEKK